MRSDAPDPPPSPAATQGPRRGIGSRPVERITDALETPSLDDRAYRVILLSNKLEVLLVHDPETDKASAAMDVNVGNFSDEEDMPGMAHAVEHLLFMGTKKYPVENAYSQYLSSHSGSSNAYTGSTSTNYFFEVAGKPSDDGEASAENPSPLYGALDRFAQFFIEPLFLASTLDRELRAVDSENKKNLQNDQWRCHQLEKSLSNPKHPYCHFSTGNLDVLKLQPEARGINVRDKFIDFYHTHYSANRMKLVVLGREPLDVLEGWVSDLFTDIPNKNLKPNRWEDEVPFGKEQLGMQCFSKPVMESRELDLFFPFLDEENHFETQPSRYISHLIGHEGPGSIMAYIKAKGWANALTAGAYPVCPGTPGLFDIQIRLTESGLKNYKEVIKVFFQYVSLLREAPPQQWIFEEQKGLADVDFKFKQKSPPSRFTSKISSIMQKPLPREWLLSGHSRLRKFDPDLITEGIECLRPDNFRMTLVARDFPGGWDQKEKWYGTEYKHQKIPADFMEEIKKAFLVSPKQRIAKLHLPHRNLFVPERLDVEKKEVTQPAIAPRIIRNDDFSRCWWKKDDSFWVPKANMVVSCKSPLLYATAANSVKTRLYTDLVTDALQEYSYDAELAGLQYSVSMDSRGLSIEVSGYNDKLSVLLEQVLVTMRDLEIKEDRFDIVKERLSRAYRNWAFQQPYHQLSDYTSWLTAEHDFTVEELVAELSSVTFDGTRTFQRELLSQLHMEIYVHGNLYKEDCLSPDTLVRTTKGPKAIRDIAIGDELFDDQDNPVRCLAAEAIQTSPDMKKVIYSEYSSRNKVSFTCTSDHIMTLRAQGVKPIVYDGRRLRWWTRCDKTEIQKEAEVLKWDAVMHDLYTEVTKQEGRRPTDGEVRQYLRDIIPLPDAEGENLDDGGKGKGKSKAVEYAPESCGLTKLLEMLKGTDTDPRDEDTTPSMIRMLLEEHMEEYLENLMPEPEDVPDDDDGELVIDLGISCKRKFASITLPTSTRASDKTYRPDAVPSSPIQETQDPESQDVPLSQATSYASAVVKDDHMEEFATLRDQLSKKTCKEANCKGIRIASCSFKTAEAARLASELLSGDHYRVVDPCAVQEMDLFTMTMEEYLATCTAKTIHAKNQGQRRLKLYRAPLRFEPYQGPVSPVPIDPYWFGFWLGDGSKSAPGITSSDREMKIYTQAYIERLNSEKPDGVEDLHLHEKLMHSAGTFRVICGIETTTTTDCWFWSIRAPNFQGKSWNPIVQGLKELGVFDDKSGGIPECYLNADEDTRLAVLAGLLDSGGYLRTTTNCYQFSQTTEEHRKIVEDAHKLAISSGIQCTNIEQYTRKGDTSPTWRFSMSKGTEKFQHHILFPRKRLNLASVVRFNRDVRPFEVEDAGQGEYRLIEVSGGLYQLSDRTVVHNCSKLTNMVVSTLKPRVLPSAQWPILRSLIYPPGSNYSFERPLKDPQNVNHAIEYLLYVGDKADRGVRARTLLLDQILHEPAFDQLRTKEQLGYVVFSGVRATATTFSFRFIIQSEKTPRFLESRIEAFLTSFAETLANMGAADFESQKKSLINKRLEKLKNLDQETSRHWNQIHTQYYDFNYAHEDAAAVRQLTKTDMIEFYAHFIAPTSKARAKLVVHLVAQAKSDVSTTQISELIKALNLESSELTGQAATDLQARLTSAHHDREEELAGLRTYLLEDLGVAEDKVEAAVEAWEKLSKEHRAANGNGNNANGNGNGDGNGNGNGSENELPQISFNGTTAVVIDDVRDLKCRLKVTGGATPVRDLSEYEDLDSKL